LKGKSNENDVCFSCFWSQAKLFQGFGTTTSACKRYCSTAAWFSNTYQSYIYYIAKKFWVLFHGLFARCVCPHDVHAFAAGVSHICNNRQTFFPCPTDTTYPPCLNPHIHCRQRQAKPAATRCRCTCVCVSEWLCLECFVCLWEWYYIFWNILGNNLICIRCHVWFCK
jgi:hypothetical protein